ncbi:serum albumin 2-like [Arapaima gigas]
MKWLTAIALLVVLSAVEGDHKPHAGNKICRFYSEIKEDGFRTLALIGLSQNLPKSTLEEFKSLIDQAVVTVAACCKEDHHKDCDKEEVEMFQSEVCASQSVAEKNGLKHCCEMSGANRTDCFVDHKSKIPVPISQEPDVPAQENCEDYKKNEPLYLGNFIYHFSKKHVMLQPQVIMGIAHKYKEILKTCCHEAKPQTCFTEKKEAFKRSTQERLTELKSLCFIREKYGDRVIKAKKAIQYSQRIPQASFEQMQSFMERVSSLTATCCKGSMIACMKARKQLVEEVCGNHPIVSQCEHLSECCKKSVTERGSCIETMKVGKRLKSLSEHYEVHEHLAELCQTLKGNPEKAMGKVVYELSRRHTDGSQQAILRHVRQIEMTLHQCCGKEDVGTCYKTAMDQSTLEKKIEEETAYYNKLCADESQLGQEGFKKGMLVMYTRIMPQASFELLDSLASQFAEIITPCCKQESKHRLLSCAENKVTNLVDATCHKLNPEKINAHITHCCNVSYSLRRVCIRDIKPDTLYKPPPISPLTFHMGPELCSNNVQEMLLATNRLLYHLVQQKTTITDEQLNIIRGLLLHRGSQTGNSKSQYFDALDGRLEWGHWGA